MVFSFFKKQAEKMPERQAAKPKPAAAALPENAESLPPLTADLDSQPPQEELPDLEFTVSSIAAANAATKASAPVPPPKPAAVPVGPPPADDLDDAFSSWSDISGINVDHDVDPIEACVEQVAVMFANGQDGAARSLLETFLQAYPGTEGQRFWLMLFDLLQVLGDRAAFDKLGVDYVHACETSPPAWHGYASACAAAPAGRGNGPRRIQLQGVLTGDGGQPLAELLALIGQKTPVVVDCGKIAGCDDEVAGQFADCLERARKARLAVGLTDIEGFLVRLNDRLAAGEAAHEPAWRLLLELLQRHGSQEFFEERAVDYAITFERSPPSWEAQPVPVVVAEAAAAPADDAYRLHGELKNCRFEDLLSALEGSSHPVLDFSEVSRLDFVSAGQLVNRLAALKAQGKEVTIRGPNRLVAELMAVVGLNRQARIIVPKS